MRTDALAENSVRLQKYIERIDLIQQAHNAAAPSIDEHPGPPPATFSSCTEEHEEAAMIGYQDFVWPWDGNGVSTDMVFFNAESP